MTKEEAEQMVKQYVKLYEELYELISTRAAIYAKSIKKIAKASKLHLSEYTFPAFIYDCIPGMDWEVSFNNKDILVTWDEYWQYGGHADGSFILPSEALYTDDIDSLAQRYVDQELKRKRGNK